MFDSNQLVFFKSWLGSMADGCPWLFILFTGLVDGTSSLENLVLTNNDRGSKVDFPTNPVIMEDPTAALRFKF